MPLHLPDPKTKEATDRRRVEAITLSGDVLLEFLFGLQAKGGFAYLPKEQLPPDARCVGFSFDPPTNALRLFVHSQSFDPVEDGYIPPEMDLTLGRITFPYVSRDGTPHYGDVLNLIATLREAGLLVCPWPNQDAEGTPTNA